MSGYRIIWIRTIEKCSEGSRITRARMINFLFVPLYFWKDYWRRNSLIKESIHFSNWRTIEMNILL